MNTLVRANAVEALMRAKIAKVLPRVTFAAIDELMESERARLGKEAMSVLGYSKLAKRTLYSGSLLDILRRLDIEPLQPRSVAAYRAKKARPGMWSGHKKGIGMLAGAAALLAAAGITASSLNTEFSRFFTAIVCIVACGLILVGCHHLFDKAERGERKTYHWERFRIERYDGSIPEFALAKAVAIKQRCGQVNVFVEHLLEMTEHTPRPMPDPFLIVVLGDETYYIDVWDEKDYEAVL